MQALVTGGGGFLGRYIVELLVARGDAVRILARGQYPELAALGVDTRQGSVCDDATVRAACAGVDTVFHVAALPAMWGRRQEILATNVRGTLNVVQACRQARVKRLVYTSTPSVVFGMDDLRGADETQPYPRRFLAHYPQSKAVAEQTVLAANGQDGVLTCALRPHLIWGPRDSHIIPLLAERARRGQLVQIGDGTNLIDITYVENAARAHVQAADALGPGSPVGGHAYFIGDAAPVNLWAWVSELLRRLHLPPPTRRLRYWQAYAIATVLETAYRVLPLRGEPRLTRFMAANFAKSHWFSHDRAKRDFGYEPLVSNEEGLARTVAWFRAQDK